MAEHFFTKKNVWLVSCQDPSRRTAYLIHTHTLCADLAAKNFSTFCCRMPDMPDMLDTGHWTLDTGCWTMDAGENADDCMTIEYPSGSP